jgi:hypothetical protein
MDRKLMAHLNHLSKSELTAKAQKMGDIIDDLEELAEALDEDEIVTLERAISEIRELRIRNQMLESRIR